MQKMFEGMGQITEMIYKNAIHYRAFRGSGAGGQHRNTTFSDIEASLDPKVADILGIPPLKAVASGRKQGQNKVNARKILLIRIREALRKKEERYNVPPVRIRNYHEVDNRVTDGVGNQWTWKGTVGKGDIGECIDALRGVKQIDGRKETE